MAQFWSCGGCSFDNTSLGSDSCEMCGLKRSGDAASVGDVLLGQKWIPAGHFVFDLQRGAGVGLSSTLLVTIVDSGSSAEASGVRCGYRVVSVDSMPVSTIEQFRVCILNRGGIGECVVEFERPLADGASENAGSLGAPAPAPLLSSTASLSCPWECPLCTFVNPSMSLDRCEACLSVRLGTSKKVPGGNGSAAAVEHVISQDVALSTLPKEALKATACVETDLTWSCKTCLFVNESNSASRCEMCGSDRSDTSTVTSGVPSKNSSTVAPPHVPLAVPPLPVVSSLNLASGCWECSTCTFQNPASKTDCCEACGTDSFKTSRQLAPGNREEDSLHQRERSALAFSQAALAGKFDKWECSACTYVNTASHFESCEVCGDNTFETSKKMCGETEVQPKKATRSTSEVAPARLMAVAVKTIPVLESVPVLNSNPVPVEMPPITPVEYKPRIQWDTLELETAPFAKGSRGQIFKGYYYGTSIAAKQLFIPANNPSIFEELETEVHALEKLSHPNVLQLFGCALDDRDSSASSDIFMVMEYCEGGNLFDYHTSQAFQSPKEFVRIIHEVLSGVAYLHRNNISHHELLILLDFLCLKNNVLESKQALKPQNILLATIGGKVKLADFGLAGLNNLLVSSKDLGTGIGSSVYTSPELFQSRGSEDTGNNSGVPNAPACTSAFDIYALGFILWQLWYKLVPWCEEPSHRIPLLVESGKRPPFASLGACESQPESMPDTSEDSLLPPSSFKRLVEACWAQNPVDRPDIQQVLKVFGAEVKADVLAVENKSIVENTAVEARSSFDEEDFGLESARQESGRPEHGKVDIIDAAEGLGSAKDSDSARLCDEVDNQQTDNNSSVATTAGNKEDSNQELMGPEDEAIRETDLQQAKDAILSATSEILSTEWNAAKERMYSELEVSPRAHASSLFQLDFFVSFDDTHEVAASMASELVTLLTQKGYSTSTSTSPSLASCFIVVLTENFFENEDCVRDLSWATQGKSFIQPVLTAADKGCESRLLRRCPETILEAIDETSFVCLDRADIYYWKTGCAKIISAKTRMDEQRHKSKGNNLWQKCASKILGARSEQNSQQPILFDFFLSYAAGPGSEIAAKLASDLEARGKKCCLSHSVRADSESATQKALVQSACVLAVISDHNSKLHLGKSPILTSSEKALQSFIHREDCMDELLWAAESGIAVQPIVLTKDKERMIDLLDNANVKALEFLGTSNYITVDFNAALEWKHGLVKIILARDEIVRKYEEGRSATNVGEDGM